MPTSFSKTVDKIEKGDNVTVVKDDKTAENGWTKVTTENGKIGYVKTSTLANEKQIREKLNIEKQIEGNISWHGIIFLSMRLHHKEQEQ